jgi:hypothetical protein
MCRQKKPAKRTDEVTAANPRIWKTTLLRTALLLLRMRHLNFSHINNPVPSRRKDVFLARVPPLAIGVRRRGGGLIPRLVGQLPLPLCLALDVEVAATQRLQLGRVLPRQGAQFVPRAA